MVKMIVGLGNPGRDYEKTKHNVGFMALDRLAQAEGVSFNKSKFEALYTEFVKDGQKVLLVKPQTYMNLSGRSVKPFMDYFKVALEDLVVVYDDMDLPIGKIRLRQKGSAGGHNGVKSLQEHLKTQAFNRIRVGIGRPLEFETVVQHVLSPFLGIYQADLDLALDQSQKALEQFAKAKSSDAFIRLMNTYNRG